ncbi:inorganic triphosphatase [soil metagenome]
MADEVELKLALTVDAADLIVASGVLPLNSTTASQRSIYFDTPTHMLHEAGLTLRIRRSKGKRIQTVKADGASAAGLFARSEWERPVKNDVPILDDTTPIRALIGTVDVAPLFEVRVERRTWEIRDEDSLIEVVLDQGHVTTQGRQSPICEIELELKQGDPNALFTLARRLDQIAPVRLGVLAKSERGYRLTGPPAMAFKAERVKLNDELNAAQAFQYIVQMCVRQFRLNEAVLLEQRNAEALHQARVAIRRLRSAFSIFGPLCNHEGELPLREGLKTLASELGDARNLDVLLERSNAGPLQNRLATAREDAYGRVEVALASPHVRALMLDLAQWTSSGTWLCEPGTQKLREGPVHEFAGGVLSHLRRRVKKDGRGLAKASDAVRHELRKDAKKLHYATEFFVTLFDRKKQKRRQRVFIVALEELQDKLGLLNDLATAPLVLDALGLADDPDAAALLGKGNKRKLIAAAVDVHDALVDAKPFWR